MLVLVANGPNASADGFGAWPGHTRVDASPGADRSPARDSTAKLTTELAVQRIHPLVARAKRRPGDDGARVPGLCVPDPFVAAPGCVARIDADADARLVDAANTSCCVRGPPLAA
jgi:hypothetical protein